MSKFSPVAIQACAVWPEGIYPVAQLGETVHHVRVLESINKRVAFGELLPERFDPIAWEQANDAAPAPRPS